MRARGIAVIALLVTWLGVSVAFLSLARPVREWAGEEWPLYLAAAAFAAFLPMIISRHPATPVWPALLGMLLVGAVLVLLNRYVGRLVQA